MKKKNALSMFAGLVALILSCTLAPMMHAGGSTSLTVTVYNTAVDEQTVTPFCPGPPIGASSPSLVTGDLVVPATAANVYNFPSSSFWTQQLSPQGTDYVDKTYPIGATSLRAELDSNNSNLTFDIRYTSVPRSLNFNFTQPCNFAGCPTPWGSTAFSGSLTTSAIVNVLFTGNTTFTKMKVCSDATCKEALPAVAKMWFDDSWSLVWSKIRVLRMSDKTWYLIADQCDGTQLVGLSQLSGQRGPRPKTVLTGYYNMPFFFVLNAK